VQLHHHEITNHALGQIGVLAHLECNIVEHGEIGKQRAELKQHAHAAAHSINPMAVEFVHQLTCHLDLAPPRLDHAPYEAQQRRLS
jgi:hypothetical protein